jgi:hypothetical protein
MLHIPFLFLDAESSQNAPVGTRFNLFAWMAGHQRAFPPVVDDEMSRGLLESASESCQFPLQFAGRHISMVIKHAYDVSPARFAIE